VPEERLSLKINKNSKPWPHYHLPRVWTVESGVYQNPEEKIGAVDNNLWNGLSSLHSPPMLAFSLLP